MVVAAVRRDPGQRERHRHGRPDFQLRADPQLREELDYCVPLGIPHSVFLGRAVDAGAPAWLDTDRGLALAWKRNQRATCTSCGTRADEWDGQEDAYLADHYTCEGCARLAEEQASNLDKGPDGASLPGQHAFLVPAHLYDPVAAALRDHAHLHTADDD